MTSKRRLASGEAMKLVRPIIWRRCAGLCEYCGVALGDFECFEAHHRKLRSRGGGDGPENIVATHPPCHDRIHARPESSQENGFMVSSWDDPASIPLLYMGRLALLGSDGSIVDLAGPLW